MGKWVVSVVAAALVFGAPALGISWVIDGHWGLGLGVAAIGPVCLVAAAHAVIDEVPCEPGA